MQKQRAARQAEEIEDRARDALGNGARIRNRHQLMNLRQIRDLGLETRGMDDGPGKIDRDGQRLDRIRDECRARNANVTGATLAGDRAVVQHNANDTLARRIVEHVRRIDVDDHDAASVTRAGLDKNVVRRVLAQQRDELRSAVNADGLRHDCAGVYTLCASGALCYRRADA